MPREPWDLYLEEIYKKMKILFPYAIIEIYINESMNLYY